MGPEVRCSLLVFGPNVCYVSVSAERKNAKTYAYRSWSVPWGHMVMCEVARTAKGTDGPDTELNQVNKAPYDIPR